MKTVIDLDGNEAEVSDDTTVDTIDGIHYLLSEARQAEEEAKIAAWEDGANDRQFFDVRAIRVPLLVEADIQINKHVDTNNANLSDWRTYRQALRDVPNQEDIYNITWPEKPATLP